MATFLSTGSLGDLGRGHMVQGKMTYSSGVPTLVSNDADATAATSEAGLTTITWGTIWSAAPTVTFQYVKATHSDEQSHHIVMTSVSTTTCIIRIIGHNDGAENTNPDPADTDEVHFIAIGIATALT